jgi:hypothetical protein
VNNVGRKPLYVDEAMQSRVMVRLPADTREVLEQLGREWEADLGTVVRRLLHDHLELLGKRDKRFRVARPG